MNNKSNYSIQFVRKEDKELIKLLYIWQISEDEKDIMSCQWTPEKQTSEFNEDSFEKFYKSIKPRLLNELNYGFLKDNVSEEFLGFISYQKGNMRNHSIEISYYFPKENRRKGFGKILLSLFLDTMFNYEKMNLNKIYAETYEGNEGSVKLLEHFGFTIDGRMREHYWFDDGNIKYDQLIYSLLKRDWKE